MADGRLVSSVLEPGGARAVSVDPERATVWAWTGGSLLALGFDGAHHFSVPLALPATIHADLAVRPEDGVVWLVAGHELRSLSASGALLASRRLDQPAVELGLDSAAGLLWVATAQSVEAFDAVSGASVRALELGRVPDVRGLGLTPAGSIWVGLRDEARLFTPDGTLLRTVASRDLVALAAAPDGGAWLADAKSLRRIDAAGRDRFTVEPFGGQGSLSTLAAHPADGSVWAAAGASLVKINAAGQVFLFPPLLAEGGATVRDLALFADAVPPTIDIVAPRDGSLLPQRSLAIEVAYADRGTGPDPSTLELRLDGAPLAIPCNRRVEGATCAPATPLAEGDHLLTATLRDFAGNLATPAEARFRIDATPPVITLLRPAAGAVVEEPGLTFEGSLSEPAALRLEGAEISVRPDGSFVHGPILLPEGESTFAPSPPRTWPGTPARLP